jgi:hypothetical protein
MRKKILSLSGALLLSAAMACNTAISAFAVNESGETTEETAVVIVEETGEVTEETVIETALEGETETCDSSGLLTPEGSLTLVDEIATEDGSGLQYMTVTTRDGSYFYLIIDRSGSEDNVYFLNAVDASDLLALMNEEDAAAYEAAVTEAEETVTPVITQTETTEAEPQQVVTTNGATSSLPLVGIFLALGAAVAGGYYFLKIKPGKGMSDVDEDRAFYDDEEYVNVDEADQAASNGEEE